MEQAVSGGDQYLVEESFGELLEALRAHEALLVVQLAVAVDDLLGGGEAALASLAGRVRQGIGDAAGAGHTTRRCFRLTFHHTDVYHHSHNSHLKGRRLFRPLLPWRT